jgi:4-hydroxythreonine-4-phosphate dehydrogenase
MEDKMIKVGITHGDINGISYELLLKTFADQRMTELCTPLIYGSPKVASYHRKALDLQLSAFTTVGRAEEATAGKVSIINCVSEEVKVELSKSTDTAAQAAAQAIESAIADLKRGAIDAIVAAPVGTQLSQSTNDSIAGQFGDNPLSIYIYNDVRLTVMTGDIPFADVPKVITEELVMNTLIDFNRSLKQDFKIMRPRIAVLSLNPDSNGSEEENVIIPAVSEAVKSGIIALGPYSADSFFSGDDYTRFDGIMAMYHDQAVPVFRALAGMNGLIYTAGLPSVLTTTIHGAAYDITGQGKASEDSLRQAVFAAIDIIRSRRNYAEATRNPLRKQYFEKGSAADEKLDLTKEDYDDI